MPRMRILQNVYERGDVLYRKGAELELDDAIAATGVRRGWAEPAKPTVSAEKTDGGDKGKKGGKGKG